jgi:hypothetical protein
MPTFTRRSSSGEIVTGVRAHDAIRATAATAATTANRGASLDGFIISQRLLFQSLVELPVAEIDITMIVHGARIAYEFFRKKWDYIDLPRALSPHQHKKESG